MKKTLLLLLSLFSATFSFAQTATNFIANDCAGNPHNLFNELDAGKVVVISWVMPCSNCVGPSVTAKNVVQSFQTSHPNRVVMYVVDDYANTTCTALNSWATSNGLSNLTTFSNASINMAHYGTAGMPKVVVLGGPNHTVFYNANNSVSQSGIQNAITTALAASPTGINKDLNKPAIASIFPNPSADKALVTFQLTRPSDVKVAVYNHLGQKVSDAFSGLVSEKENQIGVKTSNLSNGLYFVEVSIAGKSEMLRLLISR